MSNPYSAPSATFSDPDATGTYVPQLFALRGRIGRVRYLAYSFGLVSLFCVALLALAGGVHAATGVAVDWVPALLSLLMLAIGIVMARRRLNDLDRSGWIAALTLLPLANIILWLYLVCARGTPGPNRHGPAPAGNSRVAVLVACVVPLLFVTGMVAALAVPAYQNYQKTTLHPADIEI